MGIAITDISMTLTCDGDHGAEAAKETFHGGWYASLHKAAMRAGWKETKGPNGRRWLGPCCSGKGRRT